MYGIVLKSMEDYISSQGKRFIFEQIKANSGIDELTYFLIHYYPNELSLKLLIKGAAYYAMTLNEFLELLGNHWANNIYDAYILTAQLSFTQFLKGINRIHACILAGSEMQLSVSPVYISHETESGFVFYFKAKEKPLTPFLYGMVLGLGKKFNSPCEVSYLIENDFPKGFFESFKVSW